MCCMEYDSKHIFKLITICNNYTECVKQKHKNAVRKCFKNSVKDKFYNMYYFIDRTLTVRPWFKIAKYQNFLLAKS